VIAGLKRWPTLIPFVEAMIRKLDQHAPKKGHREGWQHDDPLDLMDRLHEETGELAHACCSSPRTGVLDEAADVANVAMMVADASGAFDVTEEPAPTHLASFDLVEHLGRQREFSAKAFGPHPRLKGVVAHIRKELEEIEAKPLDLAEWVDVVLLALDGAWRAGHGPEAIAAAIAAKQAKNEARTWPDWRTAAPDSAIEHDRSGEATSTLEEAIAENMAASPYVSPPFSEKAFDPFASVPLADRIAKAIGRVTSGSGLMRIPADATDPDLVLVACRERIAELERERDAVVVKYTAAAELCDKLEAKADGLRARERGLELACEIFESLLRECLDRSPDKGTAWRACLVAALNMKIEGAAVKLSIEKSTPSGT